jgi:hypothetical protein
VVTTAFELAVAVAVVLVGRWLAARNQSAAKAAREPGSA